MEKCSEGVFKGAIDVVPGTRYDVPVTSIQFDHMCASQASVRIGTENVAAYLPQNLIKFNNFRDHIAVQ